MASKRVAVVLNEHDDKPQKKNFGIPGTGDTGNVSNFREPCTIKTIRDSLTLHREKSQQHCLSHPQLQPHKLPPINHRPKKVDGDNAIRSLPSDWIPNKKKSKVIQRLMKRKEADHEATLEAMRGKMASINDNVEEDIRLLASIYKESFAASLSEMDESLANLRAAHKKEGLLSQDHFDKALEDINLNYRHDSRKIYVLIQKLKLLESHRIAHFKTFLQIAYKRLNEVAFKTPFEVQEFFVQEIQDINEITLNNLRLYQSLRMKLCMNLENETRLRLQEIQVIKMNWINYIKLSVFSNMNELSLFGEQPPEKAGEKSTKYRLDPLVINLIHSPAMPELDLDQLYEWINKVQSVVNQIDWCARDIVRSFKNAVVVMFKSYFGDMKEIADRILNLGILGDEPTEEGTRAEIICPAIADLGRRFQKMLTQLQTLWDNISDDLHKQLQLTFVFLNTFANLWETHLARINEAKNLVEKDVQNCINMNYLELSNEEANINIVIDTMRQEPVEKNLDTLLASTNKHLDELVQLYTTNKEKEAKVVNNKLMELIKYEGELYSAELANFLAEMKTGADIETEETDNGLDEIDTISILEHEINMCETQIHNLKRWRTKLYTTISEHLKTSMEETTKSTNVWIEQECEKLAVRKKISIDILHKSRYNRTKPVLYELRMVELREHNQRFQRHQAAIENQEDSITKSVDDHLILYDQEVDAFLNKSNEIKATLAKANNSSDVITEMIVYKVITDKCSKNLMSLNADFKKKCDDVMSMILKSNLNYIASMKNFEQGGNFNTEEIRSTATELAKFEKATKKTVGSVLKKASSKLQKSLAKSNAIQTETEKILKKYKEELHYKDSLTASLRDVHADIKREAYLLKCNKKSTFAKVDQIKTNCAQFAKDPNKVYELQRQVRMLSRQIMNLKTRFLRPSPEIDGHFGNLKEPDENTPKPLFPFEPVQDESFLGKCRYLIYKSFKNIQNASKDFYDANQTNKFITEDKILPTYHDFISETLPKYIYYYVQCELFWMEETLDFLKKIEELTTTLNNVSRRCLKEYKDTSIKEIKDIHRIVKNRLVEVTSDQEQKFVDIRSKLLALHGHPDNKELLDKLCEEMNEFLEERKDIFMPSLECCTCDLADMQETFMTNFNTLHEMLSPILTNTLESTLRNVLFDDYLKGQKFIEDFVNESGSLQSQKSPTSFHAANFNLDNYRSKISIPVEFKLSIEDTKDADNTLPTEMTTSETITDNMIDIQGAVSSYEAVKFRIILALQNGDQNNENQLEQWKTLWNAEIEQVKKLYTVKYDLTKN